jgi:CubicO group peptidase (beta-lactamase class C family)
MRANSVDIGRSSPGLQRASDYVTGCVERRQIAGAVMVVARQDQEAQLICIGMRDTDAHLPMEPDTIFRIASMTKPITSVGALMLVEAGRLGLDDPVSRYIPEFAEFRSTWTKQQMTSRRGVTGAEAS